jgi:hypothetical protein
MVTDRRDPRFIARPCETGYVAQDISECSPPASKKSRPEVCGIRSEFPQLHKKWALTTFSAVSNVPARRWLKGLASIIGRQSKVGWVIRKARRLVERPDPKKPTVLRGSVGVRHCESSDRIKGL